MAKRAKRVLPTAHRTGQYHNVIFEFFDGQDQLLEQTGTVVLRDDAMVLEIPEQDGIKGALVIGKPLAHHFHGSNSLRDEDALFVDARWAEFGDVFAGTWQDDADDFLFRFRLPRK